MSAKVRRERTHSSLIRLYESVYKEYVKNVPEMKKEEVKKKTKLEQKTDKKRSINSYQRFVQEENMKEKYKHLSGKERLSLIAKAWEKKKRKRKKDEKELKKSQK